MCTSVAEMDGVVFTSLLRWTKMMGGVADTIAAVYRTTNGGASWGRLITPNLTDTDAAASWLYVHLFRDGRKRILFVDNQYHLWRSTDDGNSWWEDTSSSIRWRVEEDSRSERESLHVCAGVLPCLSAMTPMAIPSYSVTARRSIDPMTLVSRGSM